MWPPSCLTWALFQQSGLMALWVVCTESSTVYSVKAAYHLVGENYANEEDIAQ